MSFFGPKEQNLDATAYAYKNNWSMLTIYNLSAHGYEPPAISNPWIDFKAFIKSFKDNFNPGWQEQQYPNQSVPIAHQSMPKRTIQIEWTVPSTNEKEAILNLRKCSWLAQSMYPTLKPSGASGNFTPRSTFIGIKFANLIQGNDGGLLPGYISSFSYTPNFIEGVHILSKRRAPKSERKWFTHSGNHLFPNLVDISIEFKPIQTRDSFGLVEDIDQDVGWNNSSWPYGVKIDKKLHPGGSDSGGGPGDVDPDDGVAIVNGERVFVG